jgi:MFS family permease
MSEEVTSASGRRDDSLDLSQALRTRSFWILAGALLAFYFYYLGVNQHLVAFVSDLGYSDARAAASLGLAVLLGAAAKLAMGLAADRFPIKAALIVNFALVLIASVLVLAAASPPLLVGFLVIHGFAVAAENVVVPVMVAECFGVRHLARIYGALMGGALGPIFAGAVFDRMGSYQMAFGTFAFVNLLALLALLGLRREVGRVGVPSSPMAQTGEPG